ncbi:glycosyltransferase family 4 protein [Planococcus sp. MERTA32b]|nr:glycosyltransferase family 4 protein [Planococcus sp. MER TA 32b]
MNILLISHYFPPEIGAPSARLYEMAKEWIKEGHEVTVLTGFPNHPTGIIPKEYRGKFSMEENMDGIRVLRSYVYATPNEGFVKKTLGHISFMFSSVLQSFFKVGKPEIVVVSSPTYFSMFSASFYSIFKKAKLVLDIRDLWPAAIVELGVLKNKTIINVLEFFEKRFYKQAAKIVVVTNSFKDNLIDRGIPSEKIEVITNGVDTKAFKYSEKARKKLREKLGYRHDDFIGLYIGAHGLSQSLHVLLDVAKELPHIKFLFVGEGAEKKKLIKKAETEKILNVRFIDGQEKKYITDYYSLADVCFIPLRNVELFKTFIPSKMFEIMSNSRPIIASLEGESEEILKRSNSALITGPENMSGTASAVSLLEKSPEKRNSMGEDGRNYVIKNYTRESLAKKYLDVLKSEVS